MKKLILFSIMTACVMSFAQVPNRAQNQQLVEALQKRTMVVFQGAQVNDQLNKRIWILESDKTSAAQELQKGLENYRVKNGVNIPKGSIAETLIGGWQPEVSKIGRSLNEISYMMGADCSRTSLANWFSTVALEQDEVIDIDQLSAQAQSCLRRE